MKITYYTVNLYFHYIEIYNYSVVVSMTMKFVSTRLYFNRHNAMFISCDQRRRQGVIGPRKNVFAVSDKVKQNNIFVKSFGVIQNYTFVFNECLLKAILARECNMFEYQMIPLLTLSCVSCFTYMTPVMKHSQHEKTASSVLFKLFISSNE